MINFVDPPQEKPFKIIHNLYNLAIKAGQKNIDAIAISSFNAKKKEVDSRFVNLKFVNKEQFIFFSNYNSPKSIAFSTHDQISALLYWPSISAQIRFKAKIKKTSESFNNNYFANRKVEKNALSISSNQSKTINSFQEVINNYEKTKEIEDLKKCPSYWGGFSFKPYEIEFWKGDDNRLNRREVFKKNGDQWESFLLQP